MARYKAPKGIINHPGVKECDSGYEGGSDYKHDVLLKAGWSFNNGRMAGCLTGFFHTVADFKQAEPIPLPANEGRRPGEGAAILKAQGK